MVRAAAVALALALGAAAPAVAQTPEQFDLICSGRYREDGAGAWRPYDARFRIDLAQRVWCIGDCPSLLPIAEVTAGKLSLMPSRGASETSDGSSQIYEIDRLSGRLSRLEHKPPLFPGGLASWWEVQADCQAAPFSGHPSARF